MTAHGDHHTPPARRSSAGVRPRRVRRARTVAATIVLACVAATAIASRQRASQAQDYADNNAPVMLAWSFVPEDTFGYTVEQAFESSSQYRGREIKRETTITTSMQLVVTGVDDDGNGTVQLTYPRVTFEQAIDQLSETITFDSAREEDLQRAYSVDPSLRPYAALASAELTLTITPAGEVTAVDGSAALIELMLMGLDGPAFEGVRASAEQQFSDEALQALFTAHFHVVTGRRQRVGDVWEVAVNSDVPGVGEVEVTREYRLASLRDEGRSAVISFTATYDVADDEAGADGGAADEPGDNSDNADDDPGDDTEASGNDDDASSPLLPGWRVTGALETASVSGELVFDVRAGRLASAETEESFETTLVARPLDSPAYGYQTQSSQEGTVTVRPLGRSD